MNGVGAQPSDTRVPLPVLGRRPAGRIGHIRRWRVAALIAVHIAMVAHITHWLIAGRTVSPVVASDAMHTLERGEVNGGAIFLLAALLGTLLFGRFMCGWVCHMGALQDLCRWLLGRAGIRPRVWRVRLLGYVPVALAVYMFVWPTLKREVVQPAAAAWWPGAAAYLGPRATFPGLSNHLMTNDMWERLPGVWVAIPFLLICGGATVYFLGGRGFCRYGCPYGGLFSPAEQLSPVRVVVDASACDQCGRCTAACSAGVRVMDETRAYGRIVSRHCMKTMDCVDACPSGALSLKLTAPAVLRRPGVAPKSSYDLTWGGEVALLATFVGSFVVVRGLYGLIPMFMSVGIALCVTALVWQSWRALRLESARFLGMQLRLRRSWKPAGAAVVAAGALTGLFLLHSGAVRIIEWQAGRIDDRVLVPRQVVFEGRRPEVPAEALEEAARALKWYRAASGWRDGGIGLSATPRLHVRMAWLHLVRGEYAEAEREFHRFAELERPGDGLAADIGRVMVLRGEPDRAAEYLRGVAEREPEFGQVVDVLARVLAMRGETGEAELVLRRRLDRSPRDPSARSLMASLMVQSGRVEEAVAEYRRAAEDGPRNAMVQHDLAVVLLMTGNVRSGQEAMERAIALEPAAEAWYARQVSEILREMGATDEARTWRVRSEEASRKPVKRGQGAQPS